MATTINDLVRSFADNVVKQAESKTVSKNNKYAERVDDTFRMLVREYGDKGRDALAVLFNDPDPRIRCTVAAFLLRYKGDEAKAVLKELSTGDGVIASDAHLVLKHWKEGTWKVDLADEQERLELTLEEFAIIGQGYVLESSPKKRKTRLRRTDRAFRRLVQEHGDQGREALKRLADPAYVDSKPKDPMELPTWRPLLKEILRCLVAGYLLRYDHKASMATLKKQAANDDPEYEKVQRAASEFIGKSKRGRNRNGDGTSF